jgi:WD40 repeat protein
VEEKVIADKKVGLSSRPVCMDVSTDGNFLAVGCYDGNIDIFNLQENEPETRIQENLNADKKNVSCVRFSGNSEYLAIAYTNPFNNILIAKVKKGFIV